MHTTEAPTTRSLTAEERQKLEDGRWGCEEVYQRRPDLIQMYQETGGVAAILERRIVAHGRDIWAVKAQLEAQGLSLSQTAQVPIESIDQLCS